ncbi:MAG: DUF29 domain-containing protein [Pseudomonadota bacterium]
MGTPYETDIVAWASEQAELLRGRRWSALDIENIAGEIADVGKSEMRELESRLGVLIGHLLKWQFQPEKRSKSWIDTIDVQRMRVADRLRRTPSLKHLLVDETWLQETWHDGLSIAQKETGLHSLPRKPLWTVDQLLDAEFFPD